MLDDIKIILMILGMAIMSAIIRFTSFFNFVKDAILGFLMGYSFYMLLDYFSLTDGVKCGFVGAIILSSRPLYDFANNFISKKLEGVLERWLVGKKRG